MRLPLPGIGCKPRGCPCFPGNTFCPPECLALADRATNAGSLDSSAPQAVERMPTIAIHAGRCSEAAASVTQRKCSVMARRWSFNDEVASPREVSKGRPMRTARRTRHARGRFCWHRAMRRPNHASTRGWVIACRRPKTRTPIRRIAVRNT